METQKISKKRGRPAKAERPAAVAVESVDEAMEQVDELLPAEIDDMELAEVEDEDEGMVRFKRRKRLAGRISNEERGEIDFQKREMQLMAGQILLHFKQQVTNKELDFEQELKLFDKISKYLGYEKEGNKTMEDVGMDSFAMKYLEISARVRTVEEKSHSTLTDKQ